MRASCSPFMIVVFQPGEALASCDDDAAADRRMACRGPRVSPAASDGRRGPDSVGSLPHPGTPGQEGQAKELQ